MSRLSGAYGACKQAGDWQKSGAKRKATASLYGCGSHASIVSVMRSQFMMRTCCCV
jgi:hypothetical protein